jgi:hypothetical protein
MNGHGMAWAWYERQDRARRDGTRERERGGRGGGLSFFLTMMTLRKGSGSALTEIFLLNEAFFFF